LFGFPLLLLGRLRESNYPPIKPFEMNHQSFHLLQVDLFFRDYKFALLCFISAFAVTLITIPPIINLINRYKLYDVPNARKEHITPTPTLGGIAIFAGMLASVLLWFRFTGEISTICFFFSIIILFGMGIMDDLKDLPARYKFMIEIALASLIAIAGIRITSFNGLFGINELPLTAQYTFTVLAIVGITNALNLIDGIDGLAGGLSFMSSITLGLFLTMSGDTNIALIAFALAGGILAFLYFNLNPARIFMGDTGSLVLGFVIAVLCVRLMQVNTGISNPVIPHAPVFVLGIVLIPVFDTLRVFALRIWRGKSPFEADRTHIHHLLTNAGISHAMATKIICFVHGLILLEVFELKNMRQETGLAIIIFMMLVVNALFKNIGRVLKYFKINPANEKWWA
jgi:UDP-GlcNAc:undecaprenyl-phosphate/decaprenyl-phosphate GlcNAc-1-phosphate transferase